MEKQVITEKNIFLHYVVLFFLLSFGLLAEKGQLVLWANQHYSETLDLFFKYITYMGDGVIFVLVTILILLHKKKFTVKVILIGIVHGLLVSFFKRILFANFDRPAVFFKKHSLLHFVDGVSVHSHFSFPSGHTATAFALATTLALIYRSYFVLYASMIAALLIGYSRMYLLQHFFEDVYGGAFIGFATAFSIYMINWKRTYLAMLLMMRKFRLYFGLPKPYPLYLLLRKKSV